MGRSSRMRVDLTGRRFSEWTVIAFHEYRERYQSFWLCECSCGVRDVIRAHNLLSGQSRQCRSCGQKLRQRARQQPEMTEEQLNEYLRNNWFVGRKP
jgi:hypothetical protein